jgi:tRNA-dihydrouridine synthase A
MMDWTDRHCRMFHRKLSKHAYLYTEMVTAKAIIHGDRERLLGYSPEEHPLALQLGGSDPQEMAEATRIATDFGYDEININVGCPSDRVKEGRFGACLMQEPDLVARCVEAMKQVTTKPVTVKCRIGVDDQDPELALRAMARSLTSVGVDALIVHARKAWLKGLSPKDNRTIPPLDYALVYALKSEHSHLPIIINGGVETIGECLDHLLHVDGVMLGRAAYQNPLILRDVDRLIYEDQHSEPSEMHTAILNMQSYIEKHRACGGKLHNITKHMLGAFNGLPGARAYRRILTEEGNTPSADCTVLHKALDAVNENLATDRIANDFLPCSS